MFERVRNILAPRREETTRHYPVVEARMTEPDKATVTRRTSFMRAPVTFRGIRITPDTIVEVSALWACGMAIAKPIASSVCDVFEVDREGNRTSMRTHPLWELLNFSPNPAAGDITAYHFWQSKIFEAVVAGDSFAEIERNRMGMPVALYHLDRGRMTPRYDASGRLYYEHRNPSGQMTPLAPRDVFHVRGPTYDGVTSYRLWEVGRLLFETARAVEVFGASYFANGAHVGEVFESDKTLTQDQWDRLEQQLDEQHAGPGAANDYMILENGLKIRRLAESLEVAQFIQTRQHLVEEVCRFAGVPPHKVFHLLRMTFNNVEEMNIDYRNETLVPWAVPIQQEIGIKLIGRGLPMEAEFDMDWVAEGNILDVSEADGRRVEHGIATRDEIRRKRGFNRMGGKAETLTVQKQMIDIEKIDEALEMGADTGAVNESGSESASRARERKVRDRAAGKNRRQEAD